MKKVRDFCLRQYKILIPVMVVGLLLIVMLFFYQEYKYDNLRNKKSEDVYQCFGGIKTEYKAQITYNLKNAIVDVKPLDAKIDYDGTPIYYKNEDKVLFPQEMTIVFPLREGSQFKLYKYATYYREDNSHFINNNVDTSEYSVFFLYDGKSVFFFPYEVELLVDKKVIKKLSSMSSVTVVGKDSLIYYDYENDEASYQEIDGATVSVQSENINVNLTEKYVISLDNEVLLFRPNKLQPVFKTIDK